MSSKEATGSHKSCPSLLKMVSTHLKEKNSQHSKVFGGVSFILIFFSFYFSLKISEFMAKTNNQIVHITLKYQGSGKQSGPNGPLVFFIELMCELTKEQTQNNASVWDKV